jgi:hypothetical protein
LRSIARLFYETARVQDSLSPMAKPENPSDWRLAASYCLERALSRDEEERRDENAELFRITRWLYGSNALRRDEAGKEVGAKVPPFAQLDAMTTEQLLRERQVIRGTIDHNRSRTRQRAVKAKSPEVLRLWRAQLQHTLRS